MLSVEDVARHWKLRPETVRKFIAAGRLPATRLGRQYRLTWQDVWSLEDGRMPRGAAQRRYELPLLTKKELAVRCRVSVRTVERWLSDGLPTRNIGGSIRFNPGEVGDWLAGQFGFRPEAFPGNP